MDRAVALIGAPFERRSVRARPGGRARRGPGRGPGRPAADGGRRGGRPRGRAGLPLAENTGRTVGLTLDALAATLEVLPSDALGALTVTEINPHHGEPDGATLDRFLQRLVPALASG
jgi:hypothetical protein